jgi:acetolactate synthase-1/2/3 large subunit
MVRQFQEQYFDSRFQSTVIGYSCPDFQDVVSAYRIPVMKINRQEEINDGLSRLFKRKGPMFLEISVNAKEKVLPKLSVNRPIEEQEPLLTREELKSNMLIGIVKDKK